MDMNEDIVEFACGIALLGIVAFSLTPAFWAMIVYLGQ
jgi:hypothetical protein